MVLNFNELKIGVVGLGYVGLPLALEFAKKFKVIGYDIDSNRIAQLNLGVDVTAEVHPVEFSQKLNISFTDKVEKLAESNFFIVTVPTPIDVYKNPDFQPLISASRLIGGILKGGDIVVYESTVYPGATEEVCVPEIEATSGLKFNRDFFCGYSPERINPGDKTRRLTNIKKVTSGSSPAIAKFVDEVYAQIIDAGTFSVSSIRIAEAAKVIENTQRDLNIALMNELAIIFNKIGVDSEEVFKAAETKWNFLPFRPGLVGGHCIGVDPYYLTYKSESVGYHPEIILAGRRLNDGMASYVASQFVKKLINCDINIKGSRVLVLGLTFKEDCPDLRNSKVIDLIGELISYGIEIDAYDPLVNVDFNIWKRDTGINLIASIPKETYDGVLIAVAHSQFRAMGVDEIRSAGKLKHVLYDLKWIYSAEESDGRL